MGLKEKKDAIQGGEYKQGCTGDATGAQIHLVLNDKATSKISDVGMEEEVFHFLDLG